MLTDITVLDIPPRLAFRLYDVVSLLDQVLQEHLGGDGDDEGGVVAAAVDIVVL